MFSGRIMTEKMWAGRFREPLDPVFDRWQRSFSFDRRLIPDEVAASRAWAGALGQAGLFSAEEVKAVRDVLSLIEQKAAESPEWLDSVDAEDVHHFVELQLVAIVGDLGYKLHTGRSRNEQIATDLRLFVRRSLDSIRGQIAVLIDALLTQAEAHASAPMPSYTHLQRAEPVTVGHWLLAYTEMFLRDAERLADCRRRVNILPLGSGAIAGPGIVLDRQAIAKELGFDAITANSMDATSDRDFALEYVHGLTILALHLSRWAEEMALFSTVEFGFGILPEPYSTGSSAMPQKKNPDPLELLRGKVGRIAGHAHSLELIMKGLPLAYNKDLQETQEPVFAATDAVAGSLEVATGFMRSVLFDLPRMAAAASSGYLNATAAARYLVSKGVPFRMAHSAVGQAVRTALDRKCELEDLRLEELLAIRAEFGPDFFSALKLDAVLASHDVPGGTAPKRVQEALRSARERVNAIAGAEQRKSRQA
jgi:argininosuccinate lyase